MDAAAEDVDLAWIIRGGLVDVRVLAAEKHRCWHHAVRLESRTLLALPPFPQVLNDFEFIRHTVVLLLLKHVNDALFLIGGHQVNGIPGMLPKYPDLISRLRRFIRGILNIALSCGIGGISPVRLRVLVSLGIPL